MGDEIGQLNEAPLIEEKQESSMRLPSPPAASSASQVLLAARARIGRLPPWVRHSERRGNGRTAVRSSRLLTRDIVVCARHLFGRASGCAACPFLVCGASMLSTVRLWSSMHSASCTTDKR